MSEEHFTYVETMTDTLEEYVLSNQLYWKMTGVQYAGTIGGTLLRLRQLTAQPDSNTQRLTNVSTVFAERTEQWMSQVEKLVQREVKTRTNNFRNYLDDMVKNTSLVTEYPNRVIDRVVLEELKIFRAEAVSSQARQTLTVVDSRLKLMSESSSFVWDDSFRDAFPEAPYWMLYVQPTQARIESLIV